MEAPWVSALLGGIGVAVVGVLLKLIEGWLGRRKTAAEAKSTDADYTQKIGLAYDKQVESLLEQVESMVKRQATVDLERAAEKAEMAQMRTEIVNLRNEVDGLRLQVRDLSAKKAAQDVEIARLRRLAGQVNG